MFTLRQILEKTNEINIHTQNLFIDFKQAYESISRDKLLSAMYELGIPCQYEQAYFSRYKITGQSRRREIRTLHNNKRV